MRIKYHLIGSVRSQARGQVQSDEVKISEDGSVNELINMLGIDPKFPMGVVINGVLKNKSSRLRDHDEVKLIPLVGGG